MPTWYLTVAAVLRIHRYVLKSGGGARELRDRGALESALARPRATFGGQPLYPTVVEKAAALLESICKNHPFVDGNKRVAFTAAGLFLKYNGRVVECAEDDAVEFMRNVASGRLNRDEIRVGLEEHGRPIR